MKTNLIIVEGLPGSGKSTTARMIADELEKKGKQVVCVDEGVKEHPADYADYDFPDCETERAMILEKWRSFVKLSLIHIQMCIRDSTRDMKPKLKHNTWLTKGHIIRTKLHPYFDNKKMCDIRPKDIIRCV